MIEPRDLAAFSPAECRLCTLFVEPAGRSSRPSSTSSIRPADHVRGTDQSTKQLTGLFLSLSLSLFSFLCLPFRKRLPLDATVHDYENLRPSKYEKIYQLFAVVNIRYFNLQFSKIYIISMN